MAGDDGGGDGDGWTYVGPGKKSGAPQRVAGALRAPARDVTMESLGREFAAKARVWRQSRCRRQLLALLERARPPAGWALRRAVCLGSGSFSRDNAECRRRSMWQLVVYVEVARALGVRELYAQEPALTPLDVQFADALGVRVLQLPAGPGAPPPALGPAKHVLGPDAWLFEPFVDMDAAMVRDVLDARVALYAGSAMKGLAESRAPRAHDVQAGVLANRFCDGMAFQRWPTFEVHPNIFDGVFVHWREEQGDG